jgi:hypothetical protein
MFQLTHKKEPARTIPTAPKPKALARAFAQPQALPQVLEWGQFLSSGPEDCEPSVEPEDFGKREVGVEVESEYDLERRIGGNVGRPGMGHSSLLTVQTVRW